MVEGIQTIDHRAQIGEQFEALLCLINRAGFALVPVRNLSRVSQPPQRELGADHHPGGDDEPIYHAVEKRR